MNHAIPRSRQNHTTFFGSLERIESGGAAFPMANDLHPFVASHLWRKWPKSSSSTLHHGHILSNPWTLPWYAAKCFEWPPLRQDNVTSFFLESPSGQLGGLVYTSEAHAEMTMFPLTLLAIVERADSKDIGTKEDRTRPVPCKPKSQIGQFTLSWISQRHMIPSGRQIFWPA